MKAIVIYKSKSGYTETYAKWIAEYHCNKENIKDLIQYIKSLY